MERVRCLPALSLPALAWVLASGCTTAAGLPAASGDAPGVRARLAPTSVPSPVVGVPVGGELRFQPVGDAVRVSGLVRGLQPLAEHAFHVHENGDCSAPDASSAGGHFNPTNAPHGAHGSATHHLGDLPPLHADATGRAAVDFTSRTLALSGPHSIVGKSLIVHRDPDDTNAQPTGNAGPRLACAVIG